MKIDKQAILARAEARADALEELSDLLNFGAPEAQAAVISVRNFLSRVNQVRDRLDREGLDMLPVPLQSALFHVPTMMKAVAGLLDSETPAGQKFGINHLTTH